MRVRMKSTHVANTARDFVLLLSSVEEFQAQPIVNQTDSQGGRLGGTTMEGVASWRRRHSETKPNRSGRIENISKGGGDESMRRKQKSPVNNRYESF